MPAAGSRRPRIVSSSVVLPAPFGPTSATCSPRSSANDDAVQQLLVAGAHVEAFGLDDDAAAARFGFRNSNPSVRRARRPGLDLLRLDPVDLLLLRLRLLAPSCSWRGSARRSAPAARCPRPAAPPSSRACSARAACSRRQTCHLPGKNDRAAALELEHGGRHRLEEPAVVRDEDHGRVDRLQQLLEPLDRLDVEVVRRLVEEQQVGLRRRARARARRASARRPRTSSSGRSRSSSVKPRPRTTAGGAVAPVVAAGVLEPRLRGRRSARACARRASPPAIAARAARSSASTAARSAVPGEDVVAQRPAARRAAAAGRAARRASPFSNASSPPSSDDLAGERAQQRRLAGAVRPGEREPVAPLDLERDAVEERRAGELLAEVGCDQDCHAVRY